VADGVAGAVVRLNKTGVWEVSVFLGSVLVNNSPYNVSMFAGPPDASQSYLQVRLAPFCFYS
jgi:hypothetical protein